MNATLREVLTRQANGAPVPELDVDLLGGLGESRLRRRRLTAVLGSAAAVVLAIALAVGLALNGPVGRGDGPVDHPEQDDTQTHPVRKVVYSEAPRLGHAPVTIHFGDRAVKTSDTFVHIDVTDDGFVYVTNGSRVWFSDGGGAEQIGSDTCAPANRETSSMSTDTVVAANAGSLIAWFDCSDLVVVDTGTAREVARQPMGSPCSWPTPRTAACDLDGIVGEHVYFTRWFTRDTSKHPGRVVERQFMFDVAAGRTRAAAPESYAADLLSHPRGLVVGDAWQTGTATDGIGDVFRAVGPRLVLWWRLPNGEQVLTSSFDTATGRAVRLRLPSGYHADPGQVFTLFEWLDDDIVALVAGGGEDGAGDILTCRLSDGRCDVAVDGREGAAWEVVPHLPLPG